MFRATAPVATFWVTLAVVVGLLADSGARGAWGALEASLPPAGLIVWCAWLLLLRPSVQLGVQKVTVVNPGRVTEIPLGHLLEVRHVLQLRFELDDGRRVSAWASPTPSKPGFRRGRSAGEPASELVELIESARADAAGSGRGHDARPVRARWDVPALAVGAVLALAVAAELLLRP